MCKRERGGVGGDRQTGRVKKEITQIKGQRDRQTDAERERNREKDQVIYIQNYRSSYLDR